MTHHGHATFEFETSDFQNNVVRLTTDCVEHATDGHGVELYNYIDDVKDTILNPDFTGKSWVYALDRIYIQENKGGRNFLRKYLVVVVNSNNDVATFYFRNDKNFKDVERVAK